MALPGFIRRAFGRGAPPPQSGTDKLPDASSGTEPDRSWRAGDMAECVVGGTWLRFTLFGMVEVTGPLLGEVRVVSAVSMDRHPFTRENVIFLRFARYDGAYQASSFRKIVPQADRAEKGDGAFMDWVRRFSAPERVQ